MKSFLFDTMVFLTSVGLSVYEHNCNWLWLLVILLLTPTWKD